MPAPVRSPYQYAVLRVVPSIERGECINAGVVLLCRARRFLAARTALHEALLAALAPGLDRGDVHAHLAAIERVAAGDGTAGPIAALTPAERFHWLTAPSSTIIQPGPVHTGLCDNPAEELERLFRELVGREAVANE